MVIRSPEANVWNGRPLSANDLRDLSTSLSSQGINAVYQEGADGLAESKEPDYRIRGKIYDNYAPQTGNVRSMWSYILESKIEKKQTKRIILNLTDSPASVKEVMKQFKNYPMKGLLDLIIIK